MPYIFYHSIVYSNPITEAPAWIVASTRDALREVAYVCATEAQAKGLAELLNREEKALTQN